MVGIANLPPLLLESEKPASLLNALSMTRIPSRAPRKMIKDFSERPATRTILERAFLARPRAPPLCAAQVQTISSKTTAQMTVYIAKAKIKVGARLTESSLRRARARQELFPIVHFIVITAATKFAKLTRITCLNRKTEERTDGRACMSERATCTKS